MLCLEKKEMRFFIRGSYADASDHAVFPIAVNNKGYSVTSTRMVTNYIRKKVAGSEVIISSSID
jgi:hypothetical protein